MGHTDIGVTLNTHPHVGLEDAGDELKHMEEFDRMSGKKPVTQQMFTAM